MYPGYYESKSKNLKLFKLLSQTNANGVYQYDTQYDFKTLLPYIYKSGNVNITQSPNPNDRWTGYLKSANTDTILPTHTFNPADPNFSLLEALNMVHSPIINFNSFNVQLSDRFPIIKDKLKLEKHKFTLGVAPKKEFHFSRDGGDDHLKYTHILDKALPMIYDEHQNIYTHFKDLNETEMQKDAETPVTEIIKLMTDAINDNDTNNLGILANMFKTCRVNKLDHQGTQSGLDSVAPPQGIERPDDNERDAFFNGAGDLSGNGYLGDRIYKHMFHILMLTIIELGDNDKTQVVGDISTNPKYYNKSDLYYAYDEKVKIYTKMYKAFFNDYIDISADNTGNQATNIPPEKYKFIDILGNINDNKLKDSLEDYRFVWAMYYLFEGWSQLNENIKKIIIK
jgi:hypothetical protein